MIVIRLINSFAFFVVVVISEPQKNVLLVVVDDLRPALGCYGDENAHTPNIDNLARRSLVFKKAYVQQALCAPSRNSFLTSRRPDTLRLYDFHNYWRNFSGNFTTLPQYFKENGYESVSFGKVFHPGISSNWSDDQPYSWSEKPYHPPSQKYMNAAVCRGPDGQLHHNLVCPVITKFQPGKTLPDLETLAAAQTFLNTKKLTEKPFFMAVGFHKPHVPLKYPKHYRDFHPIDKVKIPPLHVYPPLLPTVAWNPWNDLRKREDVADLNISYPFEPIPDNFTALIRQSYYAAVTYIDDLLGQFLNVVKEHGYFNNTIIILIGDHGWSLAEHAEWAKYSNYEVAVRVPFLLYIPGITDIQSNTVYKYSNALVELVDIFPTLAELIDTSKPLQLCPDDSRPVALCTEGTSLVPIIKHEIYSQMNGELDDLEWKTGAFSQYPRPGQYPSRHPNSDQPHLKEIRIMGYSLRTLRYRYTEWVAFNLSTFKPDWSEMIAQELYDHHLDPSENFNLSGRKEMSYIVKKLSLQLHAGWRYSLPKRMVRNWKYS